MGDLVKKGIISKYGTTKTYIKNLLDSLPENAVQTGNASKKFVVDAMAEQFDDAVEKAVQSVEIPNHTISLEKPPVRGIKTEGNVAFTLYDRPQTPFKTTKYVGSPGTYNGKTVPA